MNNDENNRVFDTKLYLAFGIPYLVYCQYTEYIFLTQFVLI